MMERTKSVAGWLETIGDTWINRAAQELGIPDDDWFSHERRLILATALLYRDFCYVENALWKLLESGAASGAELLDATVPASLPYESASRVVEALRCKRCERVIAVNAEYPETAKRLVQRATCCDPKFLITDIPSSQQLEYAYDEVLQAVAQVLRCSTRPGECAAARDEASS